MTYQLFTVRAAIGETTTEYAGTLADIVQWAQKNQDAPFNRRIMGVGWEWFTDKPGMCHNEAGEHPEDMREFEPLDNPFPVWRHVQPLAVTTENVRLFAERIVRWENPTYDWRVELEPVE